MTVSNTTVYGNESAAGNILDISRLQSIKGKANNIRESFDQLVTYMNQIVKSYDNEEIVNSFYASGNFGGLNKEKLTLTLQALNDYREAANNLVSSTILFCDAEIQRRRTGN